MQLLSSRTDNLEKQLPLLNSSSDPISYLHETIEIDVRDTPVVKDPQGCTFSSVETNFVDRKYHAYLL